MKPKYRKVTIVAPHCPNCHEMLKGNNSYFMPWQCSCGLWEQVMGERGMVGEFIIRRRLH